MLANKYFQQQLTWEQIEEGAHREFVGGMWVEMGRLQMEYMLSVGLKPSHYLLDVGCGALRGGIPLIDYLDTSHYYGVDCNPSLIEAADLELNESYLHHKKPYLAVEEEFNFPRGFNILPDHFDHVLGWSLITHLPPNWVLRLFQQLTGMGGLFDGTQIHLTFFENLRDDPGWAMLGGLTDPYIYSRPELEWIAGLAGLKIVNLISREQFNHPRGQSMVVLKGDK